MKTLVKRGKIGTGSIVAIAVFIFFGLGFAITITAFIIHRRRERNKLPPENRPTSYHPFRTNSAKSSLLANQAPTPEDDKSSMFSRDRSSVSLYLDTDVHDTRRKSVDTVPLIPLQITPAEDVHDPLDRTTSVGSGISSRSRHSLSPIGPITDEQDLGSRRTRPRSTSAASRYYESMSPLRENNPASISPPQVPKIVHTPSE